MRRAERSASILATFLGIIEGRFGAAQNGKTSSGTTKMSGEAGYKRGMLVIQ
jgi:hypothetical protein